jgi:K+/H+ antiporter YhaU regulatory subunit KhtT
LRLYYRIGPPRSVIQWLGQYIAQLRTNCSVIGIDLKDKTMTNPQSDEVLPEVGEIVLIGSPAGEAEFLKLFPPA